MEIIYKILGYLFFAFVSIGLIGLIGFLIKLALKKNRDN